ncbi:hypothetical protein AAGT13_20905 [Azotobacter salinestris]
MSIQQMLANLTEWGYSQKSIAEEVGTSQPNIHRALKGSKVSYTIGKAIENLHRAALEARSAA